MLPNWPLLFSVESRVLRDEFLLPFGQIIGRLDGIGGAYRHAGAAINATLRMHIELGGSFKLGLVLLGVNAVGGTHVHAKLIFNAAAGNYVSHQNRLRAWNDRPSLRLPRICLLRR